MCVCVCVWAGEAGEEKRERDNKVCVCVKNWLMQLCMEVKSQELQGVSWRPRADGVSSCLNLKPWESGEPMV